MPPESPHISMRGRHSRTFLAQRMGELCVLLSNALSYFDNISSHADPLNFSIDPAGIFRTKQLEIHCFLSDLRFFNKARSDHDFVLQSTQATYTDLKLSS